MEITTLVFQMSILIQINVIHNVICTFHNTGGTLKYGNAVCNMKILLDVYIIFRISNERPYLRIQQRHVSFIHIRILIWQNLSFFFNMRIFKYCTATQKKGQELFWRLLYSYVFWGAESELNVKITPLSNKFWG